MHTNKLDPEYFNTFLPPLGVT